MSCLPSFQRTLGRIFTMKRKEEHLFLVDTNVWVYYLLRDDIHYEEACRFIEQCVLSGTGLLYAPSSAKDVFYTVPRVMRRRALQAGTAADSTSYRPYAWACIRKMGEIAAVSPLSQAEGELAYLLRTVHNDYEDNLLIASAESCGADFLVTFDEGLLKHQPEICITPGRALELLGARQACSVSSQAQADPFTLSE